ncbi:MAG: HD domain-containing protein [Bradymonadales bacterium]|nr:HD domain-containing protein [Bradymonadales bacterium]
MAVQLRVSGGKEALRTVSFSAPVITIGRSHKNDLVLHDGLVSQYHGELVQSHEGYIYRDLKSRHGTVVVLDQHRYKLHDRDRPQEIGIGSSAQLRLGEMVIQVEIDLPPPSRQRERSAADVQGTYPALSTLDLTEQTDHILARAYDSLEAVTRRLSSQDPRMASIFKLSRNLNAATDLQQMLELIVESTFEAFPAANFFAITLLSQGKDPAEFHRAIPFISRSRQAGKIDLVSPLLSTSLLDQVANTRESVLFVRDFSDRDISQSIINARITACLAAPLVGQHALIGVMQADTRGLGGLFGSDDLDLFTVMASYAAFGIERARLNRNILEMFEGITRASTKAIDARDPATAGHSDRVARLSVALAMAVNEVQVGPLKDLHFTDQDLLELRYAGLLHDFGKIGVREAILTKGQRLHDSQKEAIVERFRSIALSRTSEVYRRELASAIERGVAPDPERLAQIEEEIGQIRQHLAETLQLLLSSVSAERLPPQVAQRIREIGRQRYLDLSGEERPFLTEPEIASLCIAEGTLTTGEWEEMMSHVVSSREYLEQIPWSPELKQIPAIVASHHEKLDGSGYPDRITGSDILPQTRILTICDMFDALTAIDRPYRKALDRDSAIQVLREDASRGLLDSDLLELLIEQVLPATTGR